MQKESLVIIGGGAAGLAAAITAASTYHDNITITVLEQNRDMGKKITASGNGHCNITNTQLACSAYHSTDEHSVALLTHTLKQVDFKTLEHFLQSVGILLQSKPDGRSYPFTHEAKSVTLALLQRANELGVQIHTQTKVTGITHQSNFTITAVKHESETMYRADKLIVATGSPAAPQLGGNQDVITLLQPFHHHFEPYFPSLVQLHTHEKMPASIKGVRLEADVSLFVNKQLVASSTHDLLFTDYGLSGLSVLDLSHIAAHALQMQQYVQVKVNFLPHYRSKQLMKTLEQLIKQFPKRPIETLLCTLLPRKLATQLCKESGLVTRLASELTNKMLSLLIKRLTQYPFSITATHGFKHAEVSGGGLRLSELSMHFESRHQKGLYCCGELVNITGHRGGYNLHFAFASGIIAAKHAFLTDANV